MSLIGERILSPVRKESPSWTWHLLWWDLPAYESTSGPHACFFPVLHGHLVSLGEGGGGNLRRTTVLPLSAIISRALYHSCQCCWVCLVLVWLRGRISLSGPHPIVRLRVTNARTGLPSSVGQGVNMMPYCCVIPQAWGSLASLPLFSHLSEFSVDCLLYNFQFLVVLARKEQRETSLHHIQ